MQHFIKNILVFILVAVVIILCILLIYKYKIDNLKFNNDVSIIVCGDSHTQSAIDDHILRGSINISVNSQHYLYTYNVLNYLIQNNPQIETIILGCSFHSFMESYDNYLFANNDENNRYPVYFIILDYESALKIISHDPTGVFKSGIKIFRNIIDPVIKNYTSYQDYPFCGSYYKSDLSNLNDSSIITAIKRHYYLKDKLVQGFSYLQKLYLIKIVELCNTKGIKLILINTPTNENYYKRIPDKFISNYYNTLFKFGKKIEFLDLHAYKINNEGFGDGDHLNSIGAEKFTLKLDSLIRQGK